MAFDYSGLLTVATSLIEQFGRPMTLRRASRTPADPTKPWAARQGAVTASDDQAITSTAVFLDFSRTDRDGQVVEAKRARVLFPAEAALPEEVGPDWQLDDGSRLYEVLESRPVKPGPTLLHYEVVVAL